MKFEINNPLMEELMNELSSKLNLSIDELVLVFIDFGVMFTCVSGGNNNVEVWKIIVDRIKDNKDRENVFNAIAGSFQKAGVGSIKKFLSGLNNEEL
jgi:hypothetical protein